MNQLPLVLFSGLGFSPLTLQPLQEALPGRIDIYVQPLPGTGEGSPDTEDGLEGVLDALPKRAHVMGWSLGGLVGMALAQHAPERIASLTCLASSPHLLAEANWPGVTNENWQPFTDQSPAGRERASRLLMRLQGDRSVIRDLRPHVLSPDLPAWVWGLEALGGWDLRGFVRKPTVPLCMVFAEADQLLPVALAHTLSREGLQIQIHTVPEAPHALPFACAALCATIWQEFHDGLQ